VKVDDLGRRAAHDLRRATAAVGVPDFEEAAKRHRRRRVTRTAATAFVAAVAVTLVVTLAWPSAESGRVRTKPAGGSGSWTKVPSQDTGLEPGSLIRAIVQGPRGLVAVGEIFNPNEAASAQAVWVSRDGRRWERVHSKAFGPGLFEHVVATARGIVAVGSASGRAFEPRTVWRSTDGRNWELLTRQAPAYMSTVVAGGPGLVAVGFESESAPDVVRTRIWFSRDGRRWQPAGGAGDVFPLGTVDTIASFRDGFIAAGSARDRLTAPRSQPLVWRSRDGIHWSLATTTGLDNATPLEFASRDRTVLLVGTVPLGNPCADQVGEPATWTSRDAQHWTQTPAPAGTFPPRVIASQGWWLAATTEGDCDITRAGVVVQMSRDGRSWSRGVSDPTPSRVPDALSATQHGAIAIVGMPGRSPTPDFWIWTAPKR
jgi:hypothetical protein